MRTIATLQTPTAGEIQFGDIDVLAEPGRLRARSAICRRTSACIRASRPMTCSITWPSLKGITSAADRRATVETLLVQTNLWNVRTKTVAGFSGGMRQRFGIAQALIGSPH